MSENFTIVSGTAEYTRNKRPADFEAQIPKLTVNFEVASGSDPEVVMAKVMQMTRNAVEGCLVPGTSTSGQTVAPPASSTPQPEQPKRTRKPTAAPTVPTSEPSPPAPTAPAEVDPMTALAEAQGDGEPVEGSSDAASEEDDLAALAGGSTPEPAKEYTDADLQTLCQKVSHHLRHEHGPEVGVKPIQKILAAMGVGGFTSIPQDKRADFVGKMEHLLTVKKGEML